MTRLSNVANDTIRPSIMPFIQIHPLTIEKKNVVKVAVGVGTEKLYFLSKEGLTPKGFM